MNKTTKTTQEDENAFDVITPPWQVKKLEKPQSLDEGVSLINLAKGSGHICFLAFA